MHASIEELLEIRQNEINAMSNHVRECSQCLTELQELNEIKRQIYTSADLELPESIWSRIEDSLNDESHYTNTRLSTKKTFRWNSLTSAVYALAGSVLVTGIAVILMFESNTTVIPNNNQHAFLELQELMRNSQELEKNIQPISILQSRLNTADQYNLEKLHWRLMFIDQKIHDLSKTESHGLEKNIDLWNDRVNALEELKQFYFQYQTLSRTET